MRKPAWLIYINNTIAFLLFSILKIFFKKKTNLSKEKNILFINTGQIGDLVISTVILENVSLFSEYDKIYFIVKKKYLKIFDDYDGTVKFIGWNYLKYKYNIFYRISFLKKIHQINLVKCVNITSARGVMNDEISLLSGAEEISCLSSSWRYLKKLFGKKMDSEYDLVHKFDTINEFERQVQIIERLTNKKPKRTTNFYLSDETINRTKKILKEKFSIDINANIIVISPLSSSKFRNWELKNYIDLCTYILKETNSTIILIGDKKQKNKLESIVVNDYTKIINTAGSFSVLESASIVKISKIFIGNDSGFAHIAKALNKKYIAITGGGMFNIFFPYETENNGILMYYKMDCFGCEWRCIHDKPYCVFNVKADDVLEKVKELLN